MYLTYTPYFLWMKNVITLFKYNIALKKYLVLFKNSLNGVLKLNENERY